MTNKYEIGHRNPDGNIYYTGCTNFANSSEEAIHLYCEANFIIDESEYVANKID